MNHDPYQPGKAAGNGRGKIVLAVFLAIAAFFLLAEHRAHVFGFLPSLLLLACPLMHLFHHGGHGHGGHRHGGNAADGADDDQARAARRNESRT